MSNLEELKNKYEELGKEIERLEKEKRCKRWRAEEEKEYFYIEESGYINGVMEFFDKVDDFNYKTRNYFKTEEEAQKHLDKINTYYELMDLAEELNNGEKIDWNNTNQAKYSISLDVLIGILKQVNCRYYKGLGEIHCLNEKFLDIAIDRIGEDRLESLFKEE